MDEVNEAACDVQVVAKKPRLQQWLRLNVGGVVFQTTRTTLGQDPQSFLYRLCQEDPNLHTDKVWCRIKLMLGKRFS